MKKRMSLLMTFMLCFIFGTWANTSTLTFTGACGGSGTADDGVAWTVSSDGTESAYDRTKGIHYGTGSAAVQYIKLTTSGITGTITSVKVDASTASGVTATVDVTVGGDAFGGDAQSLSSTAADYTFTGSASGEIVVNVSKPESAAKALYVKSIVVTYTPEGGDDPDPQTETKTVTFENDQRWNQVFVWAWNDSENFTGGQWPGVEITPVDGVYQWTTTGDPAYIIFSDGDKAQTQNLDFEDGATYNSQGKVIPEADLQDFSVTFTTDAGWENVFAYAWNEDNTPLAEWPGVEITATKNSEGVYTYAFQAAIAPTGIIFTAGANGPQTADLTFENGKAYSYTTPKDVTTLNFTTVDVASVPAEYVGTYGNLDNYTIADADQGVKMLIKNDEATNNCRFWNNSGALQLRVYNGATLTFEPIEEGKVIKKITFDAPSWGAGNSTDVETLTGKEWAGEAAKVVLTIAGGKTFINKITVEVGDATVPELNTYTATFLNTGRWNEVYAYAWTTTVEGEKTVTTEFLGEWPGTKLNRNEQTDMYEVTIKASEAPKNIIFSDGANTKTADLDFENGKTYEYTAPQPTTFTITVAEGIANGTVTADKAEAEAGEKVSLTVIPDENYELEKLEVRDAEQNAVEIEKDNSFIMPASNVTIFASFKKAAVKIEGMAIVGDFTGGWPIEDKETGEEDWSMAKPMTHIESQPEIWTLEIKGFEAEAKTYEFKAAANGNWNDYVLPSGNNANFVFGTDEYPAGKYDLFFKADTQRHLLNLFVTKSEESQPTEDVTANWDWQNNKPASLANVHIENGTGYVDSDVEGIQMFVDATNGKLQTNGDNVQFNTGTILQIPVKNAGDVVTVVAHPYNFVNIKIGGELSAELTTTHAATTAEAKAGYVEIESTESPYLYSVQVVQKAEAEPQSDAELVVVGNNADIFGGVWDTEGSTNTMEFIDGKYYRTFTNVQPQNENIELKAYNKTNGAWFGDINNGGNIVFNMKAAGDFTVVLDVNGDFTKGYVWVEGDNVIYPEPEATDVIANWDWQNNKPASLANVHIENGTGYVDSDVEGIQMFVDATNGKLQTNGDNAQFNAGTILQIPVKNAGDVVTVVAHPYNFVNIKVGGELSTELTTTHTATAAEAKAGYVEIESTESPYLYSVQVIQKAEAEPQPEIAYYLVGDMNKWAPAEAYKLTINEAAAEGIVEYSITTDLAAEEEFKIMKVEGETQTWYPAGQENNYKIEKASNYTVYFRPNGDGGDDWFYNCIYVVDNAQPEVLLGDANLNGEVTTSDAVLAVSFALQKEQPTPQQLLAADVDKDNEITVADAKAIVNIALEIDPGTTEVIGNHAMAYNYLTLDGQTLNLSNATAFAGFQMDVTLADGALLNGAELADRAAGMMLGYNRISDNTWRIIALSLDETTMSGNEGALLKLDIFGNSNISVSNILFVDAAARAYRLDFMGETTGINGVKSISGDADIYNVNGVRTNTTSKGVNIIRNANGKVQKVFVK